MLTELPFNFPGRVYGSAMPFGPFDRFHELWPLYLERDVELIVVLTEPAEYHVFAGMDLVSFYEGAGMDVIHVPIPDHGLPPDRKAFREAVREIVQQGHKGRSIAIHCLAGIGRTGTILACLARQNLGYSGRDAIHWVRKYIPNALENARQEQFVLNFCSEVDR